MPENFLFVDEDEDSPMKIIDFGLFGFYKPEEVFTDIVGSPYYVAPEVLYKSYGIEADVWSVGVIIYIMLCGTPPFWGGEKSRHLISCLVLLVHVILDSNASAHICTKIEQDIFEAVLRGNIDFSSDPWPNISKSAKDLVKRMLVRDPRKRITAHQALCK
ncbi:hypothetical protein ACS0TY_003284 [Phlomoides rotata]